MSYLKNKREIEVMQQAGRISALAMKQVAKNIRPGVTTKQLDDIVEGVFKENKVEAAFKKVDNYQYSICVTPNEQVVHGLPSDYKLKEGDIIGIDLGCSLSGYNSDMAQTFAVGRVTPEVEKFLKVGQETLWKAIEQAKVGNRVGDISSTIQESIEGAGFSVVKELVGHGVGKTLHEDPMIPGRGRRGTGGVLEEGLVIAIEVIYNQGKPKVVMLPDGWTITTADGSLAGLFEKTVAVTRKGPVVLTAE
ncbi:MAG TPA: type I methionyl aminopeptidase [Candidatus Nanoarchaeia archaeon]|nr:methionine aminopeptidase 1 [uncultured archaeon]